MGEIHNLILKKEMGNVKFEVGELAIINEKATSGLPDRVGEVVEIINYNSSPNYDYHVALDNGDLVPVKEKELNHLSMPELDLITYIKRGNKVLYAPMNEEVVIKKVDMIHGHVEVMFLDNNAMSVVGIEALRPIEEKEEEIMGEKVKFQIGNRVRIVSQDKYNGKIGNVIDYIGGGEFGVHVDGKDLPFLDYELEIFTEEDNSKELHFDLLFGHFENEDGTYTVPKQLLHNLLNKIL